MKDATPALTASANGLEKRISILSVVDVKGSAVPSINLMQCLIVDVRRARLGNVEAVRNGFGRLSEVLLLVCNEVFGARLNSSALNAANGVGKQFTGEVRVGAESLPVTTSFG